MSVTRIVVARRRWKHRLALLMLGKHLNRRISRPDSMPTSGLPFRYDVIGKLIKLYNLINLNVFNEQLSILKLQSFGSIEQALSRFDRANQRRPGEGTSTEKRI